MLLLARTTPGDGRSGPTGCRCSSSIMRDARRRADHPADLPTMMNHATTEVFLDGLEVPADALDRRGGPGLPLHPRRLERRAHPHRGRVHRRRALVRRAGLGLRDRARGLRPADRREPGRAVPDRPRAHRASRRPSSCAGRRRRCSTRASRAGAEANMAKFLASKASWEAANACLDTHGGFGLRGRVRRRAQVPRDAALPGRAGLRTTLVLGYVGQHVLGMPRSY